MSKVFIVLENDGECDFIEGCFATRELAELFCEEAGDDVQIEEWNVSEAATDTRFRKVYAVGIDKASGLVNWRHVRVQVAPPTYRQTGENGMSCYGYSAASLEDATLLASERMRNARLPS